MKVLFRKLFPPQSVLISSSFLFSLPAPLPSAPEQRGVPPFLSFYKTACLFEMGLSAKGCPFSEPFPLFSHRRVSRLIFSLLFQRRPAHPGGKHTPSCRTYHRPLDPLFFPRLEYFPLDGSESFFVIGAHYFLSFCEEKLESHRRTFLSFFPQIGRHPQ